MKKVRAIILFSGGLDSILAAKILQQEKIEILALIFDSPFFNIENAKKWSKELNLNPRIYDFTDEISKLIKNPPSGFGKNLNPCIDCHAKMIEIAGKILEKEGFDFIATGEVLGERPFSQTKQALGRVAKYSKYESKILRPLSAKLLPENEALKFIKKESLYEISGKKRDKQIKLAKKFGITNYPSPAGGCLLTESGFCGKLKKLMIHKKDFDKKDLEILKIGRHFYLGKSSKIILGRDKKENEILKEIVKKGDYFFDSGSHPMPSAIVRIEDEDRGKTQEILEQTKSKITEFSNKEARNVNIEFAKK